MGLRDFFRDDVRVYGAAESYPVIPDNPKAMQLAIVRVLARRDDSHAEQLSNPAPLAEEVLGKIALIHPDNLDASEYQAYCGAIRHLRAADAALELVVNSQLMKINEAQCAPSVTA